MDLELSNLFIWSQVQVLQPSTVAFLQLSVPAAHPIAQPFRYNRGPILPYSHFNHLEKYLNMDPSMSDIGVTPTATPGARTYKSPKKQQLPKKWWSAQKPKPSNITPSSPYSSHSKGRKFKPYACFHQLVTIVRYSHL